MFKSYRYLEPLNYNFSFPHQMGEMADPIQLKDEGNERFQAGELDKAIERYTKAIKLCKDKKVLAVIYRNRSACFLKKVNTETQPQAFIKQKLNCLIIINPWV